MPSHSIAPRVSLLIAMLLLNQAPVNDATDIYDDVVQAYGTCHTGCETVLTTCLNAIAVVVAFDPMSVCQFAHSICMKQCGAFFESYVKQ